MKKFLSFITVAIIATTSFAQSARQLAEAQMEDNAFYKKMLDMKPTKDAKNEAKKLANEGWGVPAGNKGLALQITTVQMYGEELMLDENGNRTKRYVITSGRTTSGSYNAAFAAARTQAQNEIAAMLKTEVVAAIQSQLDNSQSSALNAVTVDKFNERSKAIIDQTLTNSIPLLAAYRQLANNNFEVQVQIAFDKKELMARLKRNLQKELEAEGDELNEIVDQIISTKLP